MFVLRVPAIEPAARNPIKPSSAVSVSTTTTPVTGLRRTSAPLLPFRIFSSSIAPSPFSSVFYGTKTNPDSALRGQPWPTDHARPCARFDAPGLPRPAPHVDVEVFQLDHV